MKVTKVSVRIVENGTPRMKGTAYVEVDDCLAIENIRIIERADGSLFAAMPSKKGLDGQYHDSCHPTNQETRDMFNDAVIEEYKRIKNKPAGE
jgi:stage V sporulation protein G